MNKVMAAQVIAARQALHRELALSEWMLTELSERANIGYIDQDDFLYGCYKKQLALHKKLENKLTIVGA